MVRLAKHTSHYVTLDKQAMEDKRLSFRAVGLHAYLMGRPPTWQVRIDQLVNVHTEGQDAVDKALKELRDNGYAKSFCCRDPRGRVVRWMWVVFETLQLAERWKNPFEGTENPEPEKPILDFQRNNPETENHPGGKPEVGNHPGGNRA